MEKSATKASVLMKALSNETRLILLCQLGEKEYSVNELAELLDKRASSISQQLSLLRKDGLVETRREGQTIFYSLHGEEAKSIIDTLYNLYCKET